MMSLAIVFQRVQPQPVPVADYHVAVKVTTSPTTMDTIEKVTVKMHRRDDGYAALLLRYLAQHHPDVFEVLEALPRFAVNELDDMLEADTRGDWVRLSEVKSALMLKKRR